MKRLLRRRQALILGCLSLIGIAVLWQAVVSLGLVNPFFVSSPVAVAAEFAAQMKSGEMEHNLAATLHAFVLSLGLATAVGI
ncbi:MAG TPA: hypothetical protein VL574_03655, partial [Stellaceae bacterium]|nr:hypothetical protein [Stellaceae bacterium]